MKLPDVGLRQLREAKGLSQERVARLIDMSIRSYHSYEKQQRVPKLETARKISVVLGVSVDDIISATRN